MEYVPSQGISEEALFLVSQMNIERRAFVSAKHRERAFIRRITDRPWLSVLSKSECMWVEVVKETEGKCLPAYFVCVCVLLNAVQQFPPPPSPLIPFNSGLSTFLLLLICRNPYGQSVGNNRAGMDYVPRERGELVCFLHLTTFVPWAC